MRIKSTPPVGLTLAAVLAISACGGDVTGVNSGDELTSTEVAAVVAALSAAFDSAGVQAQGAPQRIAASAAAGPAGAPITIDESFNISVPCESGTLNLDGSMSGSVDDQTFDMDATISVSWDPDGCVVSDDINTFTVDGAPRVELVLDITSTQDGLTMSGTETGGFSFTSSDGRTGSCAFDATFTVVSGQSGSSTTATGTICGVDASAFETLGT